MYGPLCMAIDEVRETLQFPAMSTGDRLVFRNVGAYNWGFASGKSQTIYPWDSWEKQYTGPPPVWFHDIFYSDGRPYRPEEVELIKQLTGKKKAKSAAADKH